MLTIADLPLTLYVIVMLIMTPGSILLYSRYIKTQPGNPTNKTLLFIPPLLISLFFKKYVQEFNNVELLDKVADIFLIVTSAVFFVVFSINQYKSYKYGYVDVTRLEKFKPLYIVTLIMVVVCVIFLSIKRT